jgi:hypothetical protein
VLCHVDPFNSKDVRLLALDWHKSLFAAACVVVPIAWGYAMHRLFVWLDRRRKVSHESRPTRDDDYEI